MQGFLVRNFLAPAVGSLPRDEKTKTLSSGSEQFCCQGSVGRSISNKKSTTGADIKTQAFRVYLCLGYVVVFISAGRVYTNGIPVSNPTLARPQNTPERGSLSAVLGRKPAQAHCLARGPFPGVLGSGFPYDATTEKHSARSAFLKTFLTCAKH